jgi:DNA end-binding protein Ku
MAHAIWTGAINFGLVTIPVKLLPAIHEHKLRFNYVHAKDAGRIHYERVCSVCGNRIPWSDIVRAFELDKDQQVVLSDADFEKASPEASHAVEIVEFVDLHEVDVRFFDTPYYLEPERRGRHAYGLLRDALKRTGKVGIARVVMRTRERLAALLPEGRALVVETLHWADEVGAPADLELPRENAKGGPAEMKMATTLIEAMTTQFDPAAFTDRYRDELMAQIEAAAAGRPVPRAKGRRREAATHVVDLEDVLRKSLARAKKRPPPRRRPHAA